MVQKNELNKFLKGKDRSEWAEKFGISVHTLNMLACAKKRTGGQLALKISDLTGIPVEKILRAQ